jgi:hypothetical protein
MTELLAALGLIAGVVGAHEIGFWLGSLTRSADDPFDRQVALVRTSTAALVAFLIGFAFSGAASRFIDRQDLIVKEANALGTAYLRADTARRHLPVPIMALLLGTAAISVGMIGFGNGRVGRRFSVVDSVYGAVLVIALWMTIDLDYPGTGVIRVSNLPVAETLAAMN